MELSTFLSYRKGKAVRNKLSSDIELLPVLTPEFLRNNGETELTSPVNNVVVDKDEIILLWDGSNAGEFFRSKKGVLASTMVVLDFDQDQFLLDYLYYVFKNFEPILKSQTRGSGIPHVDKDILLKHNIEKLSKKEQSKIAEVLSTIDRAIAQTEALIAKHQRVKIGLMQDLLTRGIDGHGQLRDLSTHEFKETKVGRIPVEWAVSKLAAITRQDSIICYGIVQVRKHIEGGVPVLAIRDMKGDYHTDIHLTDPAIDAEYVRSRVESGDLLISVKGTTGRIDVVPEGFTGNISRDIAKIRLSDKNSARFYMYYFESFLGQMALDLISVGTTRKELSIAPLKELLVPVPEKKEQERIAEIFIEKDGFLSSLYRKHEKLTRIKTGLMQDLLSGEVSVTPLLEN